MINKILINKIQIKDPQFQTLTNKSFKLELEIIPDKYSTPKVPEKDT